MGNNFEYKNRIEILKLPLKEVENYYVNLRKYEYENNIPLKYIGIRKKIHNILLNLIRIDRLLSGEKLVLVKDERIKTSKPIIYACTHIGGNDIQRTFEAIKDHAYLFLGDPKGIYKDITGIILNLNGSVCTETRNKEDRKIASERTIELLNKQGSLLIYPEGAWNITENLPVMKLYPGAIKFAQETGAEIVPIAIEQYDKTFYVNIGKNFNVDKSNDAIEYNRLLRDKLATLKWEIWEKQGIKKRNEISSDFKEKFQQGIIDKCEYGFSINDVYETMYKDKNEVSYDEAFSFRKRIK